MTTSPQIRDLTGFSAVPGLRPEQVQDLVNLQKAAKKISSILDLDQLIEDVVADISASFGCIAMKRASTWSLPGCTGAPAIAKGSC